MSNDWTTWIFIALIVFLLFWNISRRRKSGNVNLDMAVAVFTDVNNNLKGLEERVNNWQSKKKFSTRSWNTYREKMGFLDSSLTAYLNESFTMMEDFNARIEMARKSQTMSTLQDMPLERLREPLTKSKEGLITWLKTTYETEQQNNPRRGCMGF
jgi:hypothetical protein